MNRAKGDSVDPFPRNLMGRSKLMSKSYIGVLIYDGLKKKTASGK